jgi:hypothetical protein
MHFGRIQFFSLRNALDHKHERAADSRDIDRLKGGVEN